MKMENKDVKNVHEDLTDDQKALVEKIEKLKELMNEEPSTRIVPTLKVSEFGIIPDVQLVLNEQKEDDTDTTDERGGSETDGEGDEGTETTESTES